MEYERHIHILVYLFKIAALLSRSSLSLPLLSYSGQTWQCDHTRRDYRSTIGRIYTLHDTSDRCFTGRGKNNLILGNQADTGRLKKHAGIDCMKPQLSLTLSKQYCYAFGPQWPLSRMSRKKLKGWKFKSVRKRSAFRFNSVSWF